MLAISPGDGIIVTPASKRALTLWSALPLLPVIIAPAWPIRRPGGALCPTINAATGFVTYDLM